MIKIEGASKDYLSKLLNLINHLDHKMFDDAIQLIADKWQEGKQIIALGNGGSSLAALHFINDWNKSVFLKSGKKFRGRTLVDNIGLLMSYANDVSFEEVFVEQLKNIMEPGDLIIAISGSGNSENVIRAVNYANASGAVTLGLCGYNGGKLKICAQHSLWINVDDMQLVEDLHLVFGHIVMQRLMQG